MSRCVALASVGPRLCVQRHARFLLIVHPNCFRQLDFDCAGEPHQGNMWCSNYAKPTPLFANLPLSMCVPRFDDSPDRAVPNGHQPSHHVSVHALVPGSWFDGRGTAEPRPVGGRARDMRRPAESADRPIAGASHVMRCVRQKRRRCKLPLTVPHAARLRTAPGGPRCERSGWCLANGAGKAPHTRDRPREGARRRSRQSLDGPVSCRHSPDNGSSVGAHIRERESAHQGAGCVRRLSGRWRPSGGAELCEALARNRHG